MTIHPGTIDVEGQKLVAAKAVRAINVIDPYTVVAGGAPRNWHVDKLANDVDIFMHLPRTVQGSGRLGSTLSRLLGVSMQIKGRDAVSEYGMNPDLRDVYEGHMDGVKIQVMRLEDFAPRVIESFPISISKILWHPDRAYLPSRDFSISIRHQAMFKTLDSYDSDHPYIRKVREQWAHFTYYSSELDFLRGVV